MQSKVAARKYGKPSKRSRAERLFAELPQSPARKPPPVASKDPVDCIVEQLAAVRIEPPSAQSHTPGAERKKKDAVSRERKKQIDHEAQPIKTETSISQSCQKPRRTARDSTASTARGLKDDTSLRVLTWDDVCPPSDRIVKIAEASYAEVYRVTNDRGTSIIKAIRLNSPLKPRTKTQVRIGLIDEEPHSEADINGELQISKWLADVPGFVVYKERYIVQGKATTQLLETHQVFQKRMKRQDPDRAQFYPSPSRYLKGTKFLVVELGDAGIALEDWELQDERELWDIFLLEAIALARAEELAAFEHRDLHEGNLCIKRVRRPQKRPAHPESFFGYSGLDITILDYGLSRAEDLSSTSEQVVAFDLERDLTLFTSTHASQCEVYRQMRSFLLRPDGKCIPPGGHRTPYAAGVHGPLSWDVYAPYTNVLWLAYTYKYLLDNFKGDRKQVTWFKKQTRELWAHLDPRAGEDVPRFGSAAEVVCFALEAGWIAEEQLLEAEGSVIDREDSIIISRDEAGGEDPLRRSSRMRRAEDGST